MIKRCRSVSGFYVKVCILILVHLMVLSIKLFVNAAYEFYSDYMICIWR